VEDYKGVLAAILPNYLPTAHRTPIKVIATPETGVIVETYHLRGVNDTPVLLEVGLNLMHRYKLQPLCTTKDKRLKARN